MFATCVLREQNRKLKMYHLSVSFVVIGLLNQAKKQELIIFDVASLDMVVFARVGARVDAGGATSLRVRLCMQVYEEGTK